MPETPITPPTQTLGNTTASPEPAAQVPAVVPPAAPPARRGRGPRLGKDGKPIVWKPTHLGPRQKEYLRGYGIKPEEWTVEQLSAIYDFSPFFNMKLAVGFVTLTGIEAINDNRQTMKWARDQLLKDEKEAPKEFKAEVAKLIPDCGRTIAMLTKQLLENAEKVEDKGKVEAPLNKAPQFNLQINNNPPPAPANNGAAGIIRESE